MIDQFSALGKTNFVGKDGFNWWIGQIAPPEPWRKVNAYQAQEQSYQHNRVKVRIIGYHPFDCQGIELPDEDLPWADVMIPNHSGSGQASLGENMILTGGETCIGFFLDGDDAQQPVIMGLLPKYNKVEDEISDQEVDSIKSSCFKPFKAHLRSSARGPDALKLTSKDKEETKVIAKDLDVSVSEANAERKANKSTTAWTPCNDSAIGKTSQAVTDFMEILQGLENVGDSWIDPITNAVVNMQAELAYVTGQVQGIMKGTINSIKTNLLKNLNKKFKKLLGPIKTSAKGVDAFFDELKLKKGFKGIMGLIYCAFEDVLGNIGNFISNMFQNLLGKVVNGALCAIEQFTAGIFAKMFDSLEGALGTVMSGLNWLVGGLSSVKGVLRKASGLAKKIFSFLSCHADACATPTKWASNIGSSLQPPEDYGKFMDKVGELGGIKEKLALAGPYAIEPAIGDATARIFGNPTPTEIQAYADDNGISYERAENFLSGGTEETIITGDSIVSAGSSMGSIERAIDQISLFGAGNDQFDVCNRKNNNPTSQEDIIPVKPGYIYPKCIPPEVQVIGSGQGAELFVVVGNDRRIFSVEVINGGSGYDENNTSISIIDNTGNGSGADVRAIVKDGVITDAVILSTGFGYCLNEVPSVGIGTSVVGTVKDVYITTPGVRYDPEDTLSFEGVDDGTFIPIVTTPSGSIAIVNFPENVNTEFTTTPTIIVNSKTGVGANIIPIMTFKGQFNTDTGAEERRARPLIGIDQVIDCIGDNKEVVGYVNGVAYSGPYHVMSNGLKMTGATHSGADSIIYDTMEESLGQPAIVSQTSSYATPETTEVAETPTPVDTTPNIVIEQTTPTMTTPMDTTTTTDTSTDTSTGNDTSSSGGGGYGGY